MAICDSPEMENKLSTRLGELVEMLIADGVAREVIRELCIIGSRIGEDYCSHLVDEYSRE